VRKSSEAAWRQRPANEIRHALWPEAALKGVCARLHEKELDRSEKNDGETEAL